MKTIVLILALCIPGLAQEWTPKLVEIRNVDINGLGGFLRTFGVNYSQVPGSRFIALTSTKNENIIAAEEALKRIDVPRKNIELAFQIVAASTQPVTEKLQADLEPVVKQLKASFVYQGYHLVDTLMVRNREGSSGKASGVMPKIDGGAPAIFEVQFQSTSLTQDPKSTMVHINHLSMNSRIPAGSDDKGAMRYTNTGVDADVDVKEGQKVVVGKANVDGKDGAIFMVVTARVVD